MGVAGGGKVFGKLQCDAGTNLTQYSMQIMLIWCNVTKLPARKLQKIIILSKGGCRGWKSLWGHSNVMQE
jgi:hypothetical protein